LAGDSYVFRVAAESCDPNTLKIVPGAKVDLKLAPLATPPMAGVTTPPDPDEVTLTVTGALLVLL